MVRVSDSTMTVAAAQDTGADTSWIAGRLVFVGTPIPDVLAAVGRWYGFEFQLADSAIADGHLSAKFDHQSERGMLVALASALNVTMSFNQRVVTLHTRKPSAAPQSRRDAPFSLRPQMEVGK
jgi:ferric-dicitrate binding protein FerR (iron transport regulator)